MIQRVFTLLIILLPVYSSAQKFNAGIRFGMDGSQVNGDRLSGFDKLGLLGGVFVNRSFTERTSLQMEMVFIQKGSRKPTDDFNTYYRMRVHYLEVPILFRYHTSTKFAFHAGPSFGFLVFSEENDQFGAYPNAMPFRKFELAGNAGLLYSFNENWKFDGRYSHSITTTRPFPGKSLTFFDKGQYNVVIEFSFLYQF